MIDGFENLKVYDACCRCQYYIDKICHNDKGTCIWKDLTKIIKALDIVKKKNVDVGAIKNCINAYAYNGFKELTETKLIKRENITQEEFDLLKEVLL